MKNLVTILLNSELSTTFTERNTSIDISTWITNKYVENLQGPSSSFHTTDHTSTSSTTVTTPTTHADAPSTHASNNWSVEDSLDELFQTGNLRSSTGSISQSICKRLSGNTSTITSPRERGYQVVKLDVYDFSRICKKQKTDCWREATYRSTFLTQSPTDPLYLTVMNLLVSVTKMISKIPNEKREEKETK